MKKHILLLLACLSTTTLTLAVVDYLEPNVIGSVSDITYGKEEREHKEHRLKINNNLVDTTDGMFYLVNKTDKDLLFNLHFNCRGMQDYLYMVPAKKVVQADLPLAINRRNITQPCKFENIKLYAANDTKRKNPLTPPGKVSVTPTFKSLEVIAVPDVKGVLSIIIVEAAKTNNILADTAVSNRRYPFTEK